MENFMKIEKLEFVKNIDKFENNSDKYVEIRACLKTQNQ